LLSILCFMFVFNGFLLSLFPVVSGHHVTLAPLVCNDIVSVVAEICYDKVIACDYCAVPCYTCHDLWVQIIHLCCTKYFIVEAVYIVWYGHEPISSRLYKYFHFITWDCGKLIEWDKVSVIIDCVFEKSILSCTNNCI